MVRSDHNSGKKSLQCWTQKVLHNGESKPYKPIQAERNNFRILKQRQQSQILNFVFCCTGSFIWDNDCDNNTNELKNRIKEIGKVCVMMKPFEAPNVINAPKCNKGPKCNKFRP